MEEKNVLDAVEDGDEITAEMIAENAWGAALDNGSDMFDVNPREHAEGEYEGYIQHIIIMCKSVLSEHDARLSEQTWSRLEEDAVDVIEERKV